MTKAQVADNVLAFIRVVMVERCAEDLSWEVLPTGYEIGRYDTHKETAKRKTQRLSLGSFDKTNKEERTTDSPPIHLP